ELALQVHREIGWLYARTGARVVSCVGGMDIRREHRALGEGADIVVGTPGRLRDHLERGRLDVSGLRAIVLDEADEMLDLGFRDDLEFLLDAAPAERRTLLFSATIPKEIAALARRYQRDAVRIATSARDEPHGDIEYRALRIAPNDVEHAVVNVLRYFEVRGALVFCATRDAVRRLHGELLERGFAVVALSGELTQADRNRALQALRDGRARVCVATDVAARGIDLPDLGLVVHADLPQNREVLLHRSGRTGRAGRKGICVLLVPHTRRWQAERLLKSARIDAAWGAPPSADEIRERDQHRLMQDPAWAEAPEDEDMAAARTLLEQRSPEQIAAALVRMHRARLPAPEEMLDEGAERAAKPGRIRTERAPPPGRAREPAPPPGRARDERAPAARGTAKLVAPDRRGAARDMLWFRMNVGRNRNADPRWLVPLICRSGHVTKRDIGEIRIFDRETKFEIARHAAAQFESALRRRTGDDMEISISPVREPAGQVSGRRSATARA
ncbi:MAG TPA: DEAD/DEAH box helicase, partial [Burkholderiaceae bacterium]|nr:DEAD/DEAH box helicase [Burkholderiaceae bacterium]